MYISIICLCISVTCIFQSVAFFLYQTEHSLITILPKNWSRSQKHRSLSYLAKFFLCSIFPRHIHTVMLDVNASLRVLALFLLPAIYHLPTYLDLFFVTVSKSRRVSLNIHEKLRSLRVFLSIESECFHVRKMSGMPNNEWSSYCVY